jgi:hypothetical protein
MLGFLPEADGVFAGRGAFTEPFALFGYRLDDTTTSSPKNSTCS